MRLRGWPRIAIVTIAGMVGLNAVVPGWQIMTEGSVYGFKLPTGWLTAYWPFADYTLAGAVLLTLIGGGGIAAAVVSGVSVRLAPVAALAMGVLLVGWIGCELVFLSQTMVMTWIILGCGVGLIGLSAVTWAGRGTRSRTLTG